MLNFKRRKSQIDTILDQYASDSAKKVFEDEEDKRRIKALLWTKIQEGISSKRVTPVLYIYYGAAAAMILLFFTAYILYVIPAGQKTKLQWTRFENTTNSMKKIWLPDSSSVWVQQNGAIAWRSDFNSVNRLVVLQKGESFFDVRRQHVCPFIVETDSVETKVLGTSFLVKKDNISHQVSVSVRTGKVQVFRNGSLIRLLHPSDQLTVDQLTPAFLYKSVPASDFLLWKQGKIILREERLNTIAKYLSQYYNVSIKLDPVLTGHKEKYTFIFSSASTIDETISVFRDIAPMIRYKKMDEKNWAWLNDPGNK